MGTQYSSYGTGFTISGHRLMTNQHVIANATDIRLRKHGDSHRWRACVEVEGNDVDLAVLRLHDSVDPEEAAAFWNGVQPCTWNPILPSLQSSVNVVGYPTGGTTICVTEGVISRIDATVYVWLFVRSWLFQPLPGAGARTKSKEIRPEYSAKDLFKTQQESDLAELVQCLAVLYQYCLLYTSPSPRDRG